MLPCYGLGLFWMFRFFNRTVTAWDYGSSLLIFAIPEQTCESWKENLLTVARMQPEHISAYSLIVEEGTPENIFDAPKMERTNAFLNKILK